MLIDRNVPGSDDWWAYRLATQLGLEFPRLQKLKDYHDGVIEVPDYDSAKLKDAYSAHKNLGRINPARVIVSAVTSRQEPLGFRTSTSNDDEGDAEVMAEWEKSNMVVIFRDILEDQGVYGRGFGIVGDDGLMGRLSPFETMVDTVSASPFTREAAIRVYHDPLVEADKLLLFRLVNKRVYVRLAIQKTRMSTIPTGGKVWHPGEAWDWVTEPALLPDLDAIPIVPSYAPNAQGQFEPHLDTLDRINHENYQRVVMTTLHAAKQMAISGDLPDRYPPDHELAGQKIDYSKAFSFGPASFWRIPAGAEIWESKQADITQFIEAASEDLKQLAMVTSTPLYALSSDSVNQSAEGAKIARESITAKVRDLNTRAGVCFAEMMRLRFLQKKEDRGTVKTLWVNPEPVSDVDKGQAASQLVGILSKKTIRREILKFTPTQMAQAEQDDADAVFMEVTDSGVA